MVFCGGGCVFNLILPWVCLDQILNIHAHIFTLSVIYSTVTVIFNYGKIGCWCANISRALNLVAPLC